MAHGHKTKIQQNITPHREKYGKVRIDGKLVTSSFRRWGCMGTTPQEFSNNTGRTGRDGHDRSRVLIN
jgi:hypothetical protein